MANSVKVKFEAIDNTQSAVKSVSAGFKKIVGAVTATIAAATGAALAVKKVMDVYVEYADQVRDVARATGASNEEASKLIQVTDDLFISYESLMASMKIGIKNGIDPSIDGLARLSDEYMALNAGSERSRFVLEKFGKGGLEMGKLLEKGAAGIREMAAAMEEANPDLILNQADIQKAQEYKQAVDNLGDSWQAFLTVLASRVAPAATDAANGLADLIGTVLENAKAWEYNNAVQRTAIDLWMAEGSGIGKVRAAFIELDPAVQEAYLAQGRMVVSAYKAGEALAGSLPSLQAAADGYDDLAEAAEKAANSQTLVGALGGIEDASGVYKTVVDAQDAYLQKSGEVYDMMAAGETVPPETLADLQKLADEYDAARAANEQWWKKFIFTTTAAKLAASNGELSPEEFNLLLQIGQQFGMIDPAVAGAYADIFNAISTVDPSNTDEVYKLLKKIQAMDGMTLDIYATIHETTETETGGETGGGGDSTCFASDTPISIPGGQKDISEFAVGDPIYCYANGALIETIVEQVLIHPSAPRTILIIETARGIICITPEHNLLIGGEWKRAESIVVGVNLTWEDGSPDAVIAITPSYYTDAVYNLHVKHESHSYIAGGFVVHNYKWDAPEGGTTDGSAPKTITNYGTINFILPKGYKMAGSMKV